jgi:hypothetical protein
MWIYTFTPPYAFMAYKENSTFFMRTYQLLNLSCCRIIVGSDLKQGENFKVIYSDICLGELKKTAEPSVRIVCM